MIKRFDQYNEEFFPISDENIPTAKEFAESNQYDLEKHDEGGYLGIDTDEFAKYLIEFAKLHVVAALDAAAKSLDTEYPNPSINKDLILKAYPNNNIK